MIVPYGLPEIFSRNNEKNERFIQLLNNACIHTRYIEDYCVSKGDLVTINEKVKN